MRGAADNVAWIAGRQHGRITRDQLVEAGVDRKRIDRWLADGRLRRVHTSVYAVGHTAPSTRGDYMAAVLAAGSTAVLSHRAAAHLLRLIRGGAPPPEVTISLSAGRQRPGIAIHRSHLDPSDTATLDGIPIATAPRTLLDLAPHLAREDLTRACHEAWIRLHTSPDLIEACIARNPRKPGVAKLRRALGTDVTLSVLEDQFLLVMDTYDLPRPRTNIDHHGDRVDCHWPDHALTVELLSYRFHGTRRAFEADVARRRRSNHLAFTYGDVFERPDETARELAPRLR